MDKLKSFCCRIKIKKLKYSKIKKLRYSNILMWNVKA